MARFDYNQREQLRRVQFYVSRVCNNDCVFCMDDDWKSTPLTPSLVDGTTTTTVSELGETKKQGVARERVLETREGRDVPELMLALDDVEAFLADHDRDTEVAITGPDPGTNRSLEDYVRRVRALGFQQIALVSNARTLSRGEPTRAQALVEAGVTRFELSIHGHDAETHDKASRRQGSFEQTLAGVRAALAARNLSDTSVRVETISVIYRDNLASLPKIARTLLRLGLDHISFNLVEPKGDAARDFEAVVPSLTEAAAAFRAMLKRFGERVRFSVDGLQPCLLPGLEGFAGNREEVALGARDGTLYEEESRDRWRRFGPSCAACLHRPVCVGVYSVYADRRGLTELRPKGFKAGALPGAEEWGRYLALFYERWETRYRAIRLQREQRNLEIIKATLRDSGSRALLRLDYTDGAGMIARLSAPGIGELSCRVRACEDRSIAAHLRVGDFVLIPMTPVHTDTPPTNETRKIRAALAEALRLS